MSNYSNPMFKNMKMRKKSTIGGYIYVYLRRI